MNNNPPSVPKPATPPKPPQPKPLLPDDEFKVVLAEIGEVLERLEGRVSEMREHSVGSHMKGMLRLLGFRPRKNWEERNYLGLHGQTVAAHKSIGEEIPAGNEELTLSVAKCVLSNLKAEVNDILHAPNPLKEAPAA